MMRAKALVLTLAVVAALLSMAASAFAEKRIALVVGNAAYPSGALATTANDAGLIAQTLQAAGFDVVGARDLEGDALRQSLRDFIDKASASGPDTVAFVYLAGHGVQLQGENYYVPVDAKLARVADVPVEALRMSDYVRSLAGLGLKATVVVLDAARPSPFFGSDPQPPAGGLALVEPDPGLLIAFNAAPGTVGPPETGAYGAYAQALAEMLRQGGLPLDEAFAQTRLRVNEATKGAEVPWHASKLAAPMTLFDRAADAPPLPEAYQKAPEARSKPIRDFAAADAYAAAVDRDTFEGYQDFLAAYPGDPMAPRVRAILAARREAIVWRRTWQTDTPQAYWSYLDRYPKGPHAPDARRRLRQVNAEPAPPPQFAPIVYDLPPPPPEETVYVERPVLVFDDPVLRLPPPPPPPVLFLPPPIPVVIAPPPPPVDVYVLPVPIYRPVPRWVVPPRYVVAPRDDRLFRRIHDPDRFDRRPPQVRPGQRPDARDAAPRDALRVALPPGVTRRAPPRGPASSPAVVTPRPAPAGRQLPDALPPGVTRRAPPAAPAAVPDAAAPRVAPTDRLPPGVRRRTPPRAPAAATDTEMPRVAPAERLPPGVTRRTPPRAPAAAPAAAPRAAPADRPPPGVRRVPAARPRPEVAPRPAPPAARIRPPAPLAAPARERPPRLAAPEPRRPPPGVRVRCGRADLPPCR